MATASSQGDGSESYKNDPPPRFGHELVKYWSFDPGYINLNHGSYGSPPGPVSQACAKLEAQIEGNPDKYIRVIYPEVIATVRTRLSKLLGTEPDEVTIVPNTTHGMYTVLRNIDWKAGDIIIKTNITYGAITRTIQHLCDTIPGLKQTSFDIIVPTTHAEIVKSFRAHVASIKSSPEFSKLDPPKVVLVLDALTSNPALLLPWEKIVELAREDGILTIVDAAHIIGQQVNINLSEIKPDFWVSNCHKWLYARRGCAVLYVPKQNQHILKTSVPTSFAYISPQDHNASEAPNFVQQFEWNGTIEMVPYLSIIAALDFREWLGGEEKINDYTRSLAIEGGKRVAEILGTSLGDQTNDLELTLNMVNIKLPIPDTPDPDTHMRVVVFIVGRTLYQYNCSVTIFHYNAAWWVRLSAQVYNEISDFEYVGDKLSSLCKELLETEIDENGNAREQSSPRTLSQLYFE